MSSGSSIFCDLKTLPEDAVFAVNSEYVADAHPDKLNLSIGAYTDDKSNVYVLQSVKKAKKMIEQDVNDTHKYLPISGYPQIKQVVGKLIFGDKQDSFQPNFLAFQTLGGTGACFLGGKFLSKYCGKNTVVTADRTWALHKTIFADLGYQVLHYRMESQQDGSLSIDPILEDLENCPEQSVVILQGCCQNPTGLDPSKEGWRRIGEIIKRRHLMPLIDSAYLGFGRSIEEDSWSIRYFAELGVEFLVSLSFSKNFGLYGERIGCLMVFSNGCEGGINSSIKYIIRNTNSNPPRFGAKIILSVFDNLYEEWVAELSDMTRRIRTVKEMLYSSLEAKGVVWNQIMSTNGFFFVCPLSKEQIDLLKSKWHVYLLNSSRVNMAGCVEARVEYLAKAIKDVVG